MSTTNGRTTVMIGLAGVAVCVALLIACADKASTTSSEGTPILTGPPPTAFPMPPSGDLSDMGWILPEGSRAKLADYHGKVLILDFYATWCEPCRRSIPHLVELQRRLGHKGLQVVGLNVGGPDDRVKVASFARELSIDYPLGFPDKTLSDLFLADNDAIPQTFVFDRQGTIVKRFIGYDDLIPGQLDQVVEVTLMKQ